MLTSIFDYRLPPELIAQKPAGQRDMSRLMVLSKSSRKTLDKQFRDFPDFLKTGDLLVVNDTRVLPARFNVRKDTGANIEVTLIRKEHGDKRWRCLARPGRRIKPGMILTAAPELSIKAIETLEDGSWIVELITDLDEEKALEIVGRAPLPPYIKRKDDDPREMDIERYQTVYAQHAGAVAAPTAGLHFTQELLRDIEVKGVGIAHVTLHVGWGSFAPVREEIAENHRVEKEFFSVSEETARAVADTKKSGGRVIAVGTTAVRALESAAAGGEIKAAQGVTGLFILPGYEFKTIDAMLTNFHLPKSSLLMLVAAFAGTEVILEAYREAVGKKYHFYSYGDAMFICSNSDL